jgi:hypothetical protein
MVGSDAEHSEKDDVVRPPRRKRRRGSTVNAATGGTASQQQTRPSCGDSSREARRSSRRLARYGKRGAAHPPSRKLFYASIPLPDPSRCIRVLELHPADNSQPSSPLTGSLRVVELDA